MKKLVSMIAMVLGLASYSNLQAQKPAVVTDNEPGWKHIGQTTASFKEQDESIQVLGADEFTALKIRVSEAPIQIERMQVFYESGDMEEIDVQKRIDEDGESEVFNLKHADRDISKVAFTYKTVSNSDGDKADVALYGLKTDQPKGADAYRDDAKDAADRTERKAEEAAEDVDRETDEARRDIDRKADNTESDLERAADKVGDGISEGVNDAAAAIKDEKLNDKVGPGGETAYVDDNGKYYYINNEGKKVFITKAQLKNKRD